MSNPTAPVSIEKYCLACDTEGLADYLLRAVAPDASADTAKRVRDAASEFWQQIRTCVSVEYPGTIPIEEASHLLQIEQAVRQALKRTPGAAVISMDRYLSARLGRALSPIFSLEMTRLANGERAPRQGSSGTIIEQAQQLYQQIGDRPVILVDDGIGSGNTLRFVVETLFRNIATENGATGSIRVAEIIAGAGDAGITAINRVRVQIVRPMRDLVDGCQARDLTLFGGRTVSVSDDRQSSISTPYIAPFTDGGPSGLRTKDLFRVSGNILRAQSTFLSALDRAVGREVTLGDATRTGFPVPLGVDREQRELTLNSTLQQVNAAALATLERQRTLKPREIVFDMDGTFYTLNGRNNGYEGSSYETAALAGIDRFIKSRENAEETARSALSAALADRCGASHYLSKRYGITRVAFFEEAYGEIDPQSIISDAVDVRGIMNRLSAEKIGSTLVTSSPKIWTQRVLEYLGVADAFDRIITGEEFSSKREIFDQVRQRMGSAPVLAVGDQFETDILPAEEAGLEALQVLPNTRPLSYILPIIQS